LNGYQGNTEFTDTKSLIELNLGIYLTSAYNRTQLNTILASAYVVAAKEKFMEEVVRVFWQPG